MPAIRKVFLSSTGADLGRYREAAFAALQKLEDWKCVRMEDFGARDWDVDRFCREKVKECDLFVGIIGHRFGAGPKGSKESYTQREYRAAIDAKRPRLLFLAPDDFPIPANQQEAMWKIKAQGKFRKEVRDSGDRIVSMGFTSPDELARQIVTGIYNWVHETSGKGGKGRKADARRYLEALWEETAYIDIRGLRVSADSVYQFRIDELYTPLTTVLAPDDKKDAAEALGAQRAAPLQEALGRGRLVLVGDPGAGKSTFLRRIAFAACETLLGRRAKAATELLGRTSCPLPVLIRAASLAHYVQSRKTQRGAGWPAEEHSPEWLIHYLQAAAQENNWGLDGGFYREQLDEGCLLMLDGLDEAPDKAQRKAMARLLEYAARAYRKTQVVATSRPPAYGGETVIPGFVTVQIAPLGEEAVDRFVANWSQALNRTEEQRKELREAVGSTPDIQRMAGNPLMLTALAALHWNRRRLPDQRSELYDSVLWWLAEAREEKPGRVKAERCLDLLRHLAFVMHSGEKGKEVEISPHTAALALAPRFREVEEDERMGAAERFLEEEEMNSGILVGRGGKLRFWHPTFQEYLAARALLWREEERRRLLFAEEKLYLPEWRETVLLLSGILCKEAPELVDGFLGEMLNGVKRDTGLAERARCVGLIGRILQDLKAWSYEIADQRYGENLNRVLEIFEANAARRIDFQTRLEAADALGQAGDPRLGENNWVRVGGGAFWMGAQKTDPKGKNYDREAHDDESPVHRVEVSAFLMGKYPVTVEEYERFVTQGGYEKKEHWAEGGYGQFKKPGDWQQQLRHPNRPVVEVSWWEAAAYCRCVGGRLPTEAEWECAARGGREGVRYPWGNEAPDEYRANFYHEKGPKQLTPVGLYPDGATPSGLQDMAGNVYEWVADWLGPYEEGKGIDPLLSKTLWLPACAD